MTRALTISYKTVSKNREKIFILLISTIIISAVMYAILLEKAVMNVVLRENITKQVSIKSNEVGDMETKYLSIKNSITLDLAHSKGFKNVEDISYISKKSLTAMVSKNEL